jgi:hypothetical protein
VKYKGIEGSYEKDHHAHFCSEPALCDSLRSGSDAIWLDYL